MTCLAQGEATLQRRIGTSTSTREFCLDSGGERGSLGVQIA